MTSLKITLYSLSSSFTDTDFPATAYLYNLVPNLKDLSRTSFYSYKGSLTTPPCYQSVKWIVLQKAISAGEREVNFFFIATPYWSELFLIKGSWLWSPANIKWANKDANIYVRRFTTVYKLLFCAHTPCMNYVTNTFGFSVRNKQLLCFVHMSRQKMEQKHGTKNILAYGGWARSKIGSQNLVSQRNDTITAFFFEANKNKNSEQVPFASTSS